MDIVCSDAIVNFSELYGFLINQNDEQLGLVYGDPGVGKSTAAKYAANKFGGVYVCCQPNWSAYSMLSHLCFQILGHCPRSKALAMKALLDYFKKNRRCLFLDEADYVVSDKHLIETIRSLHDNAGIPVILIGMSGIENKVCQRELLADRIQYFLQIGGCAVDDVVTIASNKFKLSIDNDFAAYIHKKSDGNMRKIKRALSHIERFAILNNLTKVGMSDWNNRDLIPDYAKKPNPNVQMQLVKGLTVR